MKSKIYSEKEIIKGIFQNDREVISFLYEYNFELIKTKIISEGGTLDDIKDVIHDAFLVLFVKLRKEDFSLTSSIHTYIQAVARNLWKQFLEENINRNTRIDDSFKLATDDQIEEEYVQLARRKLYLKHLEEIPGDCKRLIKMVLKGLSLDEITRSMAYSSLDFTKTKRYRCKVFLINKIINDPLYNELKNERFRATGPIPRW